MAKHRPDHRMEAQPPNFYVIRTPEDVEEHTERMLRQLRNGLQVFVRLKGVAVSEGLGALLEDMLVAVVEANITSGYLRPYQRRRLHVEIVDDDEL